MYRGKVKTSRITAYASSGRISTRMIRDVLLDHIKSKNWFHANRALAEYIDVIETQYNEQRKTIEGFMKAVEKIKPKD